MFLVVLVFVGSGQRLLYIDFSCKVFSGVELQGFVE